MKRLLKLLESFFNLFRKKEKPSESPVVEEVLDEEIIETKKEPVFESDEQRIEFENAIDGKLIEGEDLSDDEFDYLDFYNPEKSEKARLIRDKSDILSSKFEGCQTKIEVLAEYCNAVNQVKSSDPVKKELISAYTTDYAEYKKTGRFDSLKEFEKITEPLVK